MILCLHDIGFYKNPYCITPKNLYDLLLKHPLAEVHFDDGRKGVLKAPETLKTFRKKATIFLVPSFIKGEAPQREKYSKFLSIEDIKLLIKKGFEIGSHSFFHSNLTNIPYPNLTEELRNSKEWLESTFNVKISKFAFPFGAANSGIAYEARRYYKKIYTLDSPYGIQRKLVINDSPDPISTP